jgi:hypothetical protein
LYPNDEAWVTASRPFDAYTRDVGNPIYPNLCSLHHPLKIQSEVLDAGTAMLGMEGEEARKVLGLLSRTTGVE